PRFQQPEGKTGFHPDAFRQQVTTTTGMQGQAEVGRLSRFHVLLDHLILEGYPQGSGAPTAGFRPDGHGNRGGGESGTGRHHRQFQTGQIAM
ncbi:hypothetical protein DF186_15785, partial [Enterococcus hirae]